MSCRALPDTGTTRTIIHYRLVERFKDLINPTNCVIRAANQTQVSCEGSIKLVIRFQGKTIRINPLVSSALSEDMLISWHDLQRLDVISANFPNRPDSHTEPSCFQAKECHVNIPDEIDLVSEIEKLKTEFADVFDCSKVTPIAGDPVSVSMDRVNPNYKPLRISTARRIPLHFQKEADKALSLFLESGVLEKVPDDEITEWCSPGFFVPKPNGKVRLVVDYRSINKFIERPVHPFPSPRDVLKSLKSDSNWFLKFDAAHGYYQVPLDKEGIALTTFLLPSGRYRFTRLPMGMANSSDGFCARTDAIFGPIPGFYKIVDDGLLQANTKQELLQNFRTVLERCKANNLNLSIDKLKFGQEISFAGYVIGKDGVKPELKKVEAISNFPRPKDLTELRGFLGLANQLGHFIPDLAHASNILRQLLKKNVAYLWLAEHQEAFDKMKSILVSSLIVKPFDPTKETHLLTDASRLKGLGYALLQKQEGDANYSLVQCGSRSLNKAEKNYAPNELECLAIAWAIKDCDYYLLGAKFHVITDHKPLLGTFNKPLGEISNARLQRFCEKLLQYTFTISWVPGKVHLIADALSRAPIFDPPEVEEITANLILTRTISKDPALQELYDCIAEDETYSKVKDAFTDGKSVEVLPFDHPARRFKQVWADISLRDDLLILNDTRVIIPDNYKDRILEKLHFSHAGITKTKQLARQLYYWPGMGGDIENLIASCEPCQLHRDSQALPVLQIAKAEEPMHSVSLDLFEYQGSDYLIMCDRFSCHIWVHKLRRTVTEAITNQLKIWFLEVGFPFHILSDNGPQFRSEFKDFCKDNHIIHVTSSPYNSRSNGLAENAVKLAKQLIKKTSSVSEFRNALLHWLSTPLANNDKSPNELFFGRVIRTTLPRLSTLPNISTPIKLFPNQFMIGDRVRMQNCINNLWDDIGTIIEILPSGRSYLVKRDSGGRSVVRNHRFLKILRPAIRQSRVHGATSPPLNKRHIMFEN